jgi:hypothetical protein
MIAVIIPIGREVIMDNLAFKQKWAQEQMVERNFGMAVACTKFGTPKRNEKT